MVQIVVLVILCAEALLRLYALGPIRFTRSLWNVVDLVILFASVVLVAVDLWDAARSVTVGRLARVLRGLLRVMRLFRLSVRDP